MLGHGARRLGLLAALTALGVTSISAATFADGSARQGTPARPIPTHAMAGQTPAGAPSRTSPLRSRRAGVRALLPRPHDRALPVPSPHAASQRLALAPSGQVLVIPRVLAPSASRPVTLLVQAARGGHAGPAGRAALRTSAQVLPPIVASADAYVQSDLAGTNFGTAATLNNVSGTPEALAYLKFDVSGVSGTITKATFRVFTQTSSGTGYALRTVADTTWSETGLNYTNRPAVGAVIGSAVNFTANTWTSVDVTSVVKTAGTYSFEMNATSANLKKYASRESGANAPQLVLETSAPASQPAAVSAGMGPRPRPLRSTPPMARTSRPRSSTPRRSRSPARPSPSRRRRAGRAAASAPLALRPRRSRGPTASRRRRSSPPMARWDPSRRRRASQASPHPPISA